VAHQHRDHEIMAKLVDLGICLHLRGYVAILRIVIRSRRVGVSGKRGEQELELFEVECNQESFEYVGANQSGLVDNVTVAGNDNRAIVKLDAADVDLVYPAYIPLNRSFIADATQVGVGNLYHSYCFRELAAQHNASGPGIKQERSCSAVVKLHVERIPLSYGPGAYAVPGKHLREAASIFLQLDLGRLHLAGERPGLLLRGRGKEFDGFLLPF